MLEGQHGDGLTTVDNDKTGAYLRHTNRVQGGYQLVSKGLDTWADREGMFSKKLLGNKDEVKKSIVEASKVLQFYYIALTD